MAFLRPYTKKFSGGVYLHSYFGSLMFLWVHKPSKSRVQRKSFLQLAIRASWSWHLLAQTSFQLAPKTFWWAELISQFFCNLNSTKNFTSLLGKLRTEFTSLIAIYTSPGLSEMTFFACWNLMWRPCTYSVGYHNYHSHEGKKSHEQWQGCLTI